MEKIYRKSPMMFIPDAIFALCTGGLSLFITFFRYLSYKSSYLILRQTGIMARKGIFSTTSIEIPYSKINAIKIRQGILGKTFNYGDVVVLSGNDISGEVFNKFSNPEEIKAEIQTRIK